MIAAIVLWVVASETGRRSGEVYGEGIEKAAEHAAAGQTGPMRKPRPSSRSSHGAPAPHDRHGRDRPDPRRHDLEAGLLMSPIRPDSINIPLFIHVLGAMVLVGGLLVAATSVLAARGDARLLRLGYMALLAVALPGYIVMRIGAEWTYAKEHLGDAPERPGLGRDRLHHRRPRRRCCSCLPDPGGFGVRRLRGGGGTGLLRGDALRLGAPARRLRRHDLGDGRQAELTRRPGCPAEAGHRAQNDHGPHTGDPRSAVRHKRAARLAAAPAPPIMRHSRTLSSGTVRHMSGAGTGRSGAGGGRTRGIRSRRYSAARYFPAPTA